MAQAGRPDPAERERHAELTRAAIEERQIEAVQVVVLDDVGIRGRTRLPPAARSDRPRLRRRRRAPRATASTPPAVAHRDHEDAIARRVEAGRLEIDLHPAQVRRTADRGSRSGRVATRYCSSGGSASTDAFPRSRSEVTG